MDEEIIDRTAAEVIETLVRFGRTPPEQLTGDLVAKVDEVVNLVIAVWCDVYGSAFVGERAAIRQAVATVELPEVEPCDDPECVDREPGYIAHYHFPGHVSHLLYEWAGT